MPNWVSNNLTILGDNGYIEELLKQMATPYESEYYDFQENCVKHTTVEGAFLLWNSIRPTDLDAYHERDKVAKTIAERNQPKEPVEPITPQQIFEKIQEGMRNFDPTDFISEFEKDVAEGMDWYHWNIRNWGTKWEVKDPQVSWDTDEETGEKIVTIQFETAWSPPDKAITNLAKQYPMLGFALRAIDESENFAFLALWDNGELEQEGEIEVNHAVRTMFFDYCWLCEVDAMSMFGGSLEGLRKAREEQGCYDAILNALDFEPEGD